MSSHDLPIWGGAFLLSMLVHAALFLSPGSRMGAESPANTRNSAATRVTFRSVAAPAPEVPPQSEQKQAEKLGNPEPEPEPTQPPPKPAEKMAKVKPALEPKRELTRKLVQPKKEAIATARAADLPPATAGAEADNPALLEKARREYLARLMAHIESHKYFPRAARRRGLEGSVKVEFTLRRGGAVQGLGSSGEIGLFRSAAEEAVRAALPLPPPPKKLELPMDISFKMAFTLR